MCAVEVMRLVARCLVAAVLSTTLSVAGGAEPPAFPTLPADPASRYSFGSESDAVGCRQSDGVTVKTTTGSFLGVPSSRGPVRIFTRLVERSPDRGAILIVNGRTEATTVYADLVCDLVQNGYSVYLYDHRGQGFSSRLVSEDDDQTKGYIDDFDYYVADLAQFVAQVRARRQGNPRPLFALAHSMGGAITTLYIEQERDEQFKGVALVTPMHQPWALGEKQDVAERSAQRYCDSWATQLRFTFPWLSARYLDGASFDTMYADFRASDSASGNVLTSSYVRLARAWEARKATCSGSDCGSPDARIGGSTVRWFNQACAASSDARGAKAREITTPVLLLQGQEDKVVNPAAQREFCAHANSGPDPMRCAGYVVPNARHAIFLERDEIRTAALSRVLAFFDCLIDDRGACR